MLTTLLSDIKSLPQVKNVTASLCTGSSPINEAVTVRNISIAHLVLTHYEFTDCGHSPTQHVRFSLYLLK